MVENNTITNTSRAANEDGVNNDSNFNYEILIKALKKMINLLRTETSLLIARDIEGAINLKDDKHDLSTFLTMQEETLKKHPQILGSLPQEVKEEIRELTSILHDEAQRNMSEVKAAKHFNELILNIIKKAVKEEKAKFSGYNYKGRLNVDTPKRDIPHITLNEKA